MLGLGTHPSPRCDADDIKCVVYRFEVSRDQDLGRWEDTNLGKRNRTYERKLG